MSDDQDPPERDPEERCPECGGYLTAGHRCISGRPDLTTKGTENTET